MGQRSRRDAIHCVLTFTFNVLRLTIYALSVMSNLCVYDPLETYITPSRKGAIYCTSAEDYVNRGIWDSAHVETQFIASYHLDLIYCALTLYV